MDLNLLKFRYLMDKRQGKVHICRSDGTTYCRVENNGLYTANRLSPEMDYKEVPPSRRICMVCTVELTQEVYDLTHGMLDKEYQAIMQ
jgi:hypothetical protein